MKKIKIAEISGLDPNHRNTVAHRLHNNTLRATNKKRKVQNESITKGKKKTATSKFKTAVEAFSESTVVEAPQPSSNTLPAASQPILSSCNAGASTQTSTKPAHKGLSCVYILPVASPSLSSSLSLYDHIAPPTQPVAGPSTLSTASSTIATPPTLTAPQPQPYAPYGYYSPYPPYYAHPQMMHPGYPYMFTGQQSYRAPSAPQQPRPSASPLLQHDTGTSEDLAKR